MHAKIYDEFLAKFTEKTKSLKVGDPFSPDSYQGPQVSQAQYDVRSASLAPIISQTLTLTFRSAL